jgi:hypothetical protein
MKVMLHVNFEQLSTIFPHHLWLEIPPSVQEEVWQQLEDYTNDVARHNAYMNRLCLTILLKALQLEGEDTKDAIAAIPEIEDWPSVWDVVTGFAIAMGETRLVFIPCETNDLEMFEVPGEWLEIPGWVSAYYLPIQVNLDDEESWLRVWGFTPYKNTQSG